MSVFSYPQSTMLGVLALMLWSLDAALFTQINNIPVFETLCIVFSLVFLVTLIRLVITKNWHLLKQPFLVWFIGIIGICGNNVFYVGALKYAPPQQAVLIYYLWPIFTVFFENKLSGTKYYMRNYIALFAALCSLALLNLHGTQFVFELSYIKGYLCALMVAILWSVYLVFSRRIGNIPVEMIGFFFGIGALMSFLIHTLFEYTVTPVQHQIFILLFIGLFTQCIAYYAWQTGIEKGNFSLLNLLSYANPMLAITWLVLLGLTPFSSKLIIAYAILTSSIVITQSNKFVPTKQSLFQGS